MADNNTVVKKEEESFALRFWRDLVAGTAGGVAQTLSGHPLDTLKVRLQTMPTPAPGEAPMVSLLFSKLRKVRSAWLSSFSVYKLYLCLQYI